MSHRGKSVFVCLLLAVISILGCSVQAQAATDKRQCRNIGLTAETKGRFCPGVRNVPGKRRLNTDQLNRVIESLREKTGWQSLRFDEDGFLVCPQPQTFSGGSQSARNLLSTAIFGDKAYDLEAHSFSPDVRFGRLVSGTNYLDDRTASQITGFPLQIDFADFFKLHGHDKAIKAFDLGLVILHELGHGAWRLRDAAFGEEEPGECENFINQIRRELNLPERQNYHAGIHAQSMMAELHFAHPAGQPGKQKIYRLIWDTRLVGKG